MRPTTEYGVPTNLQQLVGFRSEAVRIWHRYLNGQFNFPSEERALPEIICVGNKTKGNNKTEYYLYRRNVYSQEWASYTDRLEGYALYIYKPSVSASPINTNLLLRAQSDHYFSGEFVPENVLYQTDCGTVEFYIRQNGDHLNGFIDVVVPKENEVDAHSYCLKPIDKSSPLTMLKKYQPYTTSEPEVLKCFKNN
ncbi:MAG: hypothetical protein ACXVCY_15215 [Pseudobdellovibrionaceae bacterium]